MQPEQKELSTPARETEQHGSISLAGIVASHVFRGACRVFTLWADALHLQSKYRWAKSNHSAEASPFAAMCHNSSLME